MQAKLKFLGAAQEVTGSRYVLQANGLTILVDCGLHQGRRSRNRDWDPFPVPPETIDVMLLTHAHLDHCGMIPRLVRAGFRGPIVCTAVTAEIAKVVLLDSAKLQTEDAEFKKKRHAKEGRTAPFPEVPLYTVEDVRATVPLFQPVEYAQAVALGKDVEATFYEAGHIMGSAMIRVRYRQAGEERTVVFSGDIGRWDRPILQDPTLIEQADYVLTESTYGDRVHDGTEHLADELADIVESTRRAGGNILIPSFAIERAQEVLYQLNLLLLANRIPHVRVFVDSPMAAEVTRIMDRHRDLMDEDMNKLMDEGRSPFSFPGLTIVQSVDESKSINHIKGTVVIIAGAGMCTGGRIKHHLVTNITRSESAVVFVGYQAVGTLGRQIADGAKEVRILGQTYPVRAKVVQLHGFSAHADRNEMLCWLAGFRQSPRKVFVTHGEPEVAKSFASLIHEKLGYPTSVPAFGDEAILE